MQETIITLAVKAFITKFGHAIAGVLGGLATYLVHPKLYVKDGFILAVVGGLCAYYLSPALQQQFNLSIQFTNMISFFIGTMASPVLVKINEKYPDLIVKKGEEILKLDK